MARRQKKQLEADARRFIEQMEAGDPAPVSAVMEVFDEIPELPQLWGDLPVFLENQLIDAIVGENPVRKEATRRRLGEIKADLVGSNPSALERLLAERIGICWLQMHQSEIVRLRALEKGGLSLEAAKYYERRLDHTQRRYLAAVKALAQVQRMLGITVQVNIANKQVNVAG